MIKKNGLIIGVGGIGKALQHQLLKDGYQTIHCITREVNEPLQPNITYHQIDTSDEDAVHDWCEQHKGMFALAVCTVGFLHQGNVMPEKKLEDINTEQMINYFKVNTIIPALWIRNGHLLFDRKLGGQMVFLSARVGSISDNQLGGWYGYRSSKSALNMMIKTAQIEYKRRSPKVSLIAYHPGTVDTGLSEPFQARVPAGKLFSPAQAAGYLSQSIALLSTEQAPHYIDWQGKAIPW